MAFDDMSGSGRNGTSKAPTKTTKKTSTSGGGGGGSYATYAPVSGGGGGGGGGGNWATYTDYSTDYGGYGGGGGNYASYDGGYDGGGYGGGGGGSYSVTPPPAPAPPSIEDYLKGDSAYQTQLSALQGALARYLSDDTKQRGDYQVDYGRSLKDLGYDEGTKQWNWNDTLTASGRGYQNQLNDFAARGMLQSQGYADAYSELVRMLNDQYNGVSTARTNFLSDMDRQKANYNAENTSSQQAARAEAIARRAAQYGL